MFLTIHIFIAIVSIIVASITAVIPTKLKLITTYAAALATLISGLVLVMIESVSLVHVCISGSIFLAIVIWLCEIARKKLEAFMTAV